MKEQEEQEEPTVHLYASTGISGSKNGCDMGYTYLEWRNMTIEEKTDTISVFMSNVADVWVAGPNGENIDD